jgi:thiosulfate reductase cytochrome b subunit
VQPDGRTDLFDGNPVARSIHLVAMICAALFIGVHLTLMAIFPRIVVTMIAGVAAEPEENAS